MKWKIVKAFALGILLFCLFLFVKVQNQEKILPEYANWKCEKYFVHGQYVDTTYMICSFIPQKHNYQYRSGRWKYWNYSGQLIAEGVLKRKVHTDRISGCSFDILEGIIDENTWEFWNDEGKRIAPSETLIKELEACVYR